MNNPHPLFRIKRSLDAIQQKAVTLSAERQADVADVLESLLHMFESAEMATRDVTISAGPFKFTMNPKTLLAKLASVAPPLKRK